MTKRKRGSADETGIRFTGSLRPECTGGNGMDISLRQRIMELPKQLADKIAAGKWWNVLCPSSKNW